jgi:hypothetical protein
LAANAELTTPKPEDRLGVAISVFNEQQLGVKPLPVTPEPALLCVRLFRCGMQLMHRVGAS